MSTYTVAPTMRKTKTYLRVAKKSGERHHNEGVQWCSRMFVGKDLEEILVFIPNISPLKYV